MRYLSLRIVSSFYHIVGLVGSVIVVILFFFFVYGALTIVDSVAGAQGTVATPSAYIAVLLPPFYFLIAGLVACLLSYAFGTFIRLMIDVEAGIRSIDYRLGRDDYVPRTGNGMWDDAPEPIRRAPRRPTVQHSINEGSLRPRAKWDVG